MKIMHICFYKHTHIKTILRTSIVFFVILSLILYSCKKPKDSLGSDIGNLDGQIGSKVFDTTITAVSVLLDSVRTDRVAAGMLGSFFDPIFGQTTADLYTDFRLNQLNATGYAGAIVDSVILTFRYNNPSFYGNVNKYRGYQTFTVYRLLESMKVQTSAEAGYYSGTNLQYDENNPLATISFVPNVYDSIELASSKQPAQFRVKLNKSFGQQLLTGSNTAFANDDSFRTYFKGLFIKSKPITTPGNGGILSFLMPSAFSKLAIYYNDTSVFEAGVKENSVWINKFSHNYANAEFNIVNGEISGETNLYLQPMSGMYIKVNLPNLDFFKNNKQYAINKAELIFTVDENKTKNSPLPSILYLQSINSSGNRVNVADATSFSSSVLDGLYNSTKKQYRFLITFHVKNIISGIVNNDPLVIDYAERRASRADRVVFNGTDASEGKLKFRIYYTELN
jgi:hypothetical protein